MRIKPKRKPLPKVYEAGVHDKITGLSEMQRLFVQHYLITLNATESARRAVYKDNPDNPNQICVNAQTLLKTPKIWAEIKRLKEERLQMLQIEGIDIVEQMYQTLFLDPIELVDDKGKWKHLRDIPPHVRRCITKVRRKKVVTKKNGKKKIRYEIQDIELMDKDLALQLAMKYKGLFKDDKLNQQATIHPEVNINVFMQNNQVPSNVVDADVIEAKAGA